MTAHKSELDKDHLLKLGSEVSRIATSLARISAGTEQSELNKDEPIPEVAAETVAAVIRARRLRTTYFKSELFADPAWDMMLELFHAELVHRRISTSALCAVAGVPETTAHRWLKNMIDERLFVRREDPLDARRIYVELHPDTSVALKRFFGGAAAV
ncbi:MAG TPA: hypothetical protein VF098_12180 [Sphingomicrobium sp.]